MNFEQDYVMRMIKGMVKALALLMGKKSTVYELPVEEEYTTSDDLYQILIHMVEEGNINEAENLLYERMERGDSETLKVALAFYSYLGDLEPDFLESHQYSTEEVILGMKALAKRMGYEGVLDAFMHEDENA